MYFPGGAIRVQGCNKFAIRQDTRSKEGYFYALTNPATQGIGTCGQRNQVVVTRSPNLIDWQTCGVVLWDDTGLGVAESIAHTGLYPTRFIKQ